MNCVVFPSSTTNIFPAVNSKCGGQYITEFNLRSRESVGTSESIQYMVGPSYVHSESDFYVRSVSDISDYFPDSQDIAKSGVLEILPGRAVVDGYFIESLVPIAIDLEAENLRVQDLGLNPVSGDLSIGLRVMYSTEATVAGTLLVENDDSYFEGIQIVILPRDQFFTPEDKPTSQMEVTAHIKLADFNYYNGTISNIVNNYPEKCTILPASRVGNVDHVLSDAYVRKTGLNPNKLYAFAGYGTLKDSDGNPLNMDTWCDATDSLMVWDRGTDSELLITVPDDFEDSSEAHFRVVDSKVQLYVPHKQPHYDMRNNAGEKQIYKPKTYDLPTADFTSGTSGIVDFEYTKHVKEVADLIRTLYNLSTGKQRQYIQILETRDIGVYGGLPEINKSWEVGDYILVGSDRTVKSDTADSAIVAAPSTLYVVLPGLVASVMPHTDKPSGIELARVYRKYGDPDVDADGPNRVEHAVYTSYFNLVSNQYRGEFGSDYFVVEYTDADGNTEDFYYVVSSVEDMVYSDPIMLTGEIPLAQVDQIGGFLNVDTSYTDYGYVIRDSNGHLRLLDYALLRSGTLAYQLGQDITIPSGLTTAEIQKHLDEYVNQRIAFPNAAHIQESDTPNVINIYLNLPTESSDTLEVSRTLNIYDIDSRFNTAVCIHIMGAADSNTIINIADCERVRIGNTVSGTPTINLYRSCLYYDCDVLDRLATIRDLKLWYVKYTDLDPNLVVDNLTVREVGNPITGTELEFWSDSMPNDNHYVYALQSITFGSDGTIVGCTMLVKNTSTSNVELGKSVVLGSFELPQGTDLLYPTSRLTKSIKITGQFVSAYPVGVSGTRNYLVQDTSFTIVTQVFDPYSGAAIASGSVSFLTDCYYVSKISGLSDTATSIPGWEPDTYHVFYGNSIS